MRDAITLTILFISLYFEVFMLITHLERAKMGKIRRQSKNEADVNEFLPGVTIIVPCYNEEKTVAGTLQSLLELDYPSDRLSIIAIDDGSTDGTREVLSSFEEEKRIKILSKENGGKHTALNIGIGMATTEFVGCLDSDSFVERTTLRKIVSRFSDPKVMAVVPSLHIHKAKGAIQRMQKVEYLIGVFLRSTLSELNALYVTPGPFSIFRKSVFETIGYYKKAYNTEDMEMAMRMQSNNMKIANAYDAAVFTSSPRNIRALYKQRVRWTSGFLQNLKHYKFMLFNPKYGHIGAFVLPTMMISSVTAVIVAGLVVYDLYLGIHTWLIHLSALGLRAFEWSWPNLNWYFTRTTPVTIGGLVAFIMVITFIVTGWRLSRRNRPGISDFACYAILYSLIAPFWLVRSLANLALDTQTKWR